MKKFMFSAVALVAFSFAGMANNSVEKSEKECKESQELNQEADVLGEKCADVYSSNLHTFMDSDMDFLDAHFIATMYYEICVETTYPDNNW